MHRSRLLGSVGAYCEASNMADIRAVLGLNSSTRNRSPVKLYGKPRARDAAARRAAARRDGTPGTGTREPGGAHWPLPACSSPR